MTTPCIICVAITGSVPTQKDNPAVPITIAEQIESTQDAFEAGAAGLPLAVFRGYIGSELPSVNDQIKFIE